MTKTIKKSQLTFYSSSCESSKNRKVADGNGRGNARNQLQQPFGLAIDDDGSYDVDQNPVTLKSSLAEKSKEIELIS